MLRPQVEEDEQPGAHLHPLAVTHPSALLKACQRREKMSHGGCTGLVLAAHICGNMLQDAASKLSRS